MNNLIGGGICSLCKTPGANMATCPLNSKAKNPDAKKHYLIKKKPAKHVADKDKLQRILLAFLL